MCPLLKFLHLWVLALILSGFAAAGSSITDDQVTEECQVRWWKRDVTSDLSAYYKGQITTKSDVLVHIDVRDKAGKILAHSVAFPDSEGHFISHMVTATRVIKGRYVVSIRCHPREHLPHLLENPELGVIVYPTIFFEHYIKSPLPVGGPGSYRPLPIRERKILWPPSQKRMR